MGWIPALISKTGNSMAFLLTMGPDRWLWIKRPISLLSISLSRSSDSLLSSNLYKMSWPSVPSWRSGCWASQPRCSSIFDTLRTLPDMSGQFLRRTISKRALAILVAFWAMNDMSEIRLNACTFPLFHQSQYFISIQFHWILLIWLWLLWLLLNSIDFIMIIIELYWFYYD